MKKTTWNEDERGEWYDFERDWVADHDMLGKVLNNRNVMKVIEKAFGGRNE